MEQKNISRNINMLDIISNNPYRVLGVYSTSLQRERSSNLTKIKNALRVGKPVSFPSDMTHLMSELTRTNKMVSQASTGMGTPAKRFLYAQFWFASVTPDDEIALNHLVEGNIEAALHIWNKEDNASSLQNRVVYNLISDNIPEAIACAEKLYASFKEDFVRAVMGNNSVIDIDKIEQNFLRELCAEMDAMELLHFVSDLDWKRHISNDSLESSERVRYAEERYNTGVELMRNTNECLNQLKTSMGQLNQQYQEAADKASLEILQCGIDYFCVNNMDNDAPKAMELLSYALSVAVGTETKGKCQKEIDRLQEIIDTLPPELVREEAWAIEAELREFAKSPQKTSHAIALLVVTKPHLQAMKAKLGAKDPHYLSQSTAIVIIALDIVMSEVHNKIEKQTEVYYGDIIESSRRLRYLKNPFSLMDDFDINDSFRDHYNENRIAFLKVKKRQDAKKWFYGIIIAFIILTYVINLLTRFLW